MSLVRGRRGIKRTLKSFKRSLRSTKETLLDPKCSQIPSMMMLTMTLTPRIRKKKKVLRNQMISSTN